MKGSFTVSQKLILFGMGKKRRCWDVKRYVMADVIEQIFIYSENSLTILADDCFSPRGYEKVFKRYIGS